MGGLSAFLAPGLALAQPSAAAEAEARASIVALLRSVVGDMDRPLTGVSVAWLQGETRVSRAWAGWRSIGAEHPTGSQSLEAGTLFRIASISKLAVALAMLRLHDARVLDLDEDLSASLKHSLRHPGHPGVAITPRLLLSHRSGLADKLTLPLADGEALRRALASPAQWGTEAPGRMFRYSNFGIAVLATAMEAAARQPFEGLMERWLFDPLGMSARFLPTALRPEQREQLATLYRRPSNSSAWVAQADGRNAPPAAPLPASLPAPGENASVYAPQGGLRISVPDLSRMTKMLMLEGRWEGRRLISADSYEQLLRPHWRLGPENPGETAGGLYRSWGLGLQVFTDQHDPSGGDRLHPRGGWQGYGHLGMAYGLRSGLLFQPPVGQRPAWGLVYVINGMSQAAEEAPGLHSSFSRSEERLLERLLDTLAATRDST